MKTCTYCKREMIKKSMLAFGYVPDGLTETRDHVIPYSKGGRKTVPCCLRCNNLKGDMMPDVWERYMADNPLWWASQPSRKRKPTIFKSESSNRIAAPKFTAAQTLAFLKLSDLRTLPGYLPVPQSYECPIAQLAYEMAMQNPRNRVGLDGPARAVKAPKSAIRSMTANENAKRLREYWQRQAGTEEPPSR